MPEEIGPAGGAGTPAQAAQRGERQDLRVVFLAIIALVLMGWALKGLAVVLMPLTAAILIALAVMPVRDWVAARVPGWMSWLGVGAAMAVVFLVLAVFIGVLVLAARQIVGELPVGPGEVVEMIQGRPSGESEDSGDSGGGENAVAEGAVAGAEAAPEVADEASGGAGEGETGARSGAQAGGDGGVLSGLFPGSAMDTFRQLGERALGAAGGAAAAILNSAVSVLASLVLVLFLTLLILAESGDWRRKVIAALPWPDDWRLKESSDVIAQKARAYMLSQALLGLVSACLYALWLGFWGIGLLLVWPLLIFVLNFIPTVGSLVGGTLPVAYTLITRDVGTAVAVGLGILAIENVMGNLVGPRVQGKNLALSPLVILVALAFWGWTWGIAGALLAVPVTVGMVVLGAHVPVLRPWALLLSNQTGWAGLDDATTPD
ncbi:MAG TPA: AI-2E family transporter [Rubellimicrobium sp.]|jgi:AI-2 transport protein TqsA|nr:AI-2E family transporter [Rubellimicrobium sp.]